ncbi:hypothetical protein TTHERM_01270150 (macronuclear) [Tetrahymena thermophila SB210]|uniref:Uncharacterized protein n=1 Tax=Tetrahymena thermophila (strain SB210) TaxID=312017 RepID=Q22QR2_TETTS|nr:hypothetical protein TTHERM_01270150 [Tetrahymena thermophila SB210]EAR87610.1 hypothetical protein TTHERM_01270150 [Tetrahymena thermophila SB210]|eukprot:XP_001007855.1 hypothetical protein TTHERM_01270150 [Tetrahymena thermophila SB210]
MLKKELQTQTIRSKINSKLFNWESFFCNISSFQNEQSQSKDTNSDPNKIQQKNILFKNKLLNKQEFTNYNCEKYIQCREMQNEGIAIKNQQL